MVVDANGTYLDSGGLTAEANFNQINVVNSIKPALALSPTYEYGTEIYAPWTGNPIAVGTQLIEALNNGQVQLNSVASTDGSIQLGSNSASYPSDSHSSSISVSVSSNNLSSYGLNGQVYISMQNFYNGISTSVNGNVNLYSNGTQTLDTTSNSSSTWHNNLSGRYNSSCDGTTCTMVFTSFGQFFNLGCANNDQGACGTGDNGTVTISFPQNYASSYALTLAQGLPYPTAYIGLGGQDFGVAIGSASGSYAPAISVADAPADGIFTFNGSYQNGQSSSSTSFAIGGLNQGDVVYSTTLNFTPSTAYALSSFNITQVSKSS
jgi:hypothetical protein